MFERWLNRHARRRHAKLHAEMVEEQTVCWQNGHRIRKLPSVTYGEIFCVGETGKAERTLEEALARADRTQNKG